MSAFAQFRTRNRKNGLNSLRQCAPVPAKGRRGLTTSSRLRPKFLRNRVATTKHSPPDDEGFAGRRSRVRRSMSNATQHHDRSRCRRRSHRRTARRRGCARRRWRRARWRWGTRRRIRWRSCGWRIRWRSYGRLAPMTPACHSRKPIFADKRRRSLGAALETASLFRCGA
jgi:hypothetical protein